MRTKTQKLMLQGGVILLGALLVSSIGGWARRATADDQPAPLTAPALIGELRSLEPSLAFRLVKIESNFNPKAKSKVGAIGYTQILPSTARLYEPGLTTQQLYDRSTNLRLGFRYLRDLLERYEGNPEAKLRLALLAYNRGPGKVQELLDAGRDPQNGYATTVMKGYRRKS